MPPPSVRLSEPSAAQPKLQTMKLWLGQDELTAELALTAQQMQTGMMFRTNMAENEAMLFVFGAPVRASFWMKNCVIPLSAAYIDPDGTILEIHPLQPHDTNSVVAASDRIQFVLETRQGWFPAAQYQHRHSRTHRARNSAGNIFPKAMTGICSRLANKRDEKTGTFARD